MSPHDASPLSPAPSSAAPRWGELDLLRSLAAMLMIANHAIVTWGAGGPSPPLDAAVAFVGGTAPVFFFFTTGLGQGVRGNAPRGPARRPPLSLLGRALVLLLADAALWISSETRVGLDFLGFIALATLCLEAVQRSSRPAAAGAVAAGLVLVLRFAIAPRLGLPASGGAGIGALHAVLGDAGVPGISYPLCPWAAFALVGFVAGRWAAEHADRLRASRTAAVAVLAGAALAGFGLSLLLLRRGMVFFRWGSMSFAYFVFASSAATAGLAAVLALAPRLPAGALTRLSLAGTASFVLVPTHYAIIDLAGHLGWSPHGLRLILVLLIVGPAIVAASKAIDAQMRALLARGRRQIWIAGLAAAMALMLAGLATTPSADAARYVRWVAQLAACGLFVLVAKARAPRLDPFARLTWNAAP